MIDNDKLSFAVDSVAADVAHFMLELSPKFAFLQLIEAQISSKSTTYKIFA